MLKGWREREKGKERVSEEGEFSSLVRGLVLRHSVAGERTEGAGALI